MIAAIATNGRDEKVVAASDMKRTRNIFKDERLFHPCYASVCFLAHDGRKKHE